LITFVTKRSTGLATTAIGSCRVGGKKRILRKNTTTGTSTQPNIFLYFKSEEEIPTTQLKAFLSKSKALVLERAVSDGVDKIEGGLNEVLKGRKLPYIFASETGTLDHPDLVSIYLLIEKHPTLKHIYLERSPYTVKTDPWNEFSNARIDRNLAQPEQLKQLHSILKAQAELHKVRDAKLAELIGTITQEHSGNVTVVRGRAHRRSLENACKARGLNSYVYEAPLQGKQLLQESLLSRMAGDEEPNQNELEAALQERIVLGGVR
jgi:hypothetical protein